MHSFPRHVTGVQIKLWSPGELCPVPVDGRTGNWTAWLIACTVIVARNTFHDHVTSPALISLLVNHSRVHVVPLLNTDDAPPSKKTRLYVRLPTTSTPSIRVGWQLGFNEPVVQLVAGKNKVSLHTKPYEWHVTECKSGQNHRRAEVCKRIWQWVHNHQGDAHFTQIGSRIRLQQSQIFVWEWKGEGLLQQFRSCHQELIHSIEC